MIDPGSFVAQKYQADEFGPIDAVLLTHEHSDHVHAQLVGAVQVNAKRVIANRSTANVLGELVTEVVEDGNVFQVGEMKITARELPHVAMIDGSPGPQNTGYVIDDVLFHPGDGIKIDDVNVSVGAIPVAGPDISPRDAYELAMSIGCKVMIPIHFDYFREDPDVIVQQVAAKGSPFQVIALQDGESYDTEDLIAS